MLEYLSDANTSCGTGRARHDGLFAVQGRAEQILNNWVSSYNSETGRNAVRAWIKKFVSKEINGEGNNVTRSGILLVSRRMVDESFILGFDIQKLFAQLRQLCPWTVDILEHFSISTRQRNKLGAIAGGLASARVLRFQTCHEKVATTLINPGRFYC